MGFMIRKIAKKEFIEMCRDERFRFVGGFVLVLLITTMLAGWSHYRSVTAEREVARNFDEQQWLMQPPRNPHSAAHFGKYAFKPITPISFLDNGVNSYLGIAVWLEAHYQNPFRYRPVEDSTVVQRFGELTAAVVLQLLLPLVIILLTFSTFAGERESGTLRQLLSVGVAPHNLFFGKALGVAAALLFLIVPATIIGVIALALLTTGTSADGLSNSAGRFAFMMVSYLLYLFAFLAIGLAVSAYFRKSQIALLVLFAFWIFNCLLLPRVAADTAQKVYPTMSSIEFWERITTDMNQGIDGHNPRGKRLEEAKQALLAKYGVARVEDLPINFVGWSLQQSEEYGNRVFDLRYGELWETIKKQNQIFQLSSVFAPLPAIKSISMSMAGTDFDHHRHFSIEAENYRRMINKILNEDYMNNSRTGDTNYVADSKLWQSIPQFQYQLPDATWAIRTQILPFTILILWAFGALCLAVFAVKKVRPE